VLGCFSVTRYSSVLQNVTFRVVVLPVGRGSVAGSLVGRSVG
jgi:predicted aconitase with swiveling domain